MTINEIANHVNQQLKNILISDEDVTPYVVNALHKTQKCFLPNQNKYYNRDDNFSVFHSGQYSIFLYYLGNDAHKEKNEELGSKLYYLNKILHGVDWYHEIELPSYWGVEHPVGSVLGRAVYSDGLFIYQGCTVGGNKGKYPVLGRNVIMYSNSSILGDSKIGDNVVVSTGVTVKDKIIPSNSLIFEKNGDLVIKEKDETYMYRIIDELWKRDGGK